MSSKVLILCLIMDFTTQYITEVQCSDMCKCFNRTIVCIAETRTAFHLPKFSNDTKDITINGYNIKTINKTYMENIPTLIERLNLAGNNISVVGKNTFTKFSHLILVDLSKNHINFAKSITGMANLMRIVFTVKLDSINLTNVPMRIFSSPKVTNLSLSNNQLHTFYLMSIKRATKLQVLDLSSNKLSIIDSEYFYNSLSIRYLNLSNNELNIIPLDVYSICIFPFLEILDLSKNKLQCLPYKKYGCLPKLRTLILDGNYLHFPINYDFSYVMPNITVLSLNEINNQQNTGMEINITSQSLQLIFLAGNGINSSTMETINIDGCPYLVELDMSYNSFSDFTVFESKVRALKFLKILRLNKVNAEKMPHKIIEILPNLEQVYLTGNKISSLYFKEQNLTNSSLSTLYLDSNIIHSLDVMSTTVFRSLRKINLADNPFDCSCETFPFLELLKDLGHIGILLNFPHGYRCASPPLLWNRNTMINDYNPTEDDCTDKSFNYVTVLAPPFCFITACVITSTMAYIGRWQIRYRIILWKIRKKKLTNPEEKLSFVYDAFVVYCGADRIWVHDSMLSAMEKDKKFKLCVHYRDFEVGKATVDNIVEKIDQSRKIIFVLSNDFSKSKWCQFELKLAQEQFLNEQQTRFIPIILKHIDLSKANHSVHALVTMTTYLEWPRQTNLQSMFWKQLSDVLQ